MSFSHPHWLYAACLVLFLTEGCYYDASPPSQERLDEYRPFVALRVTGMSDSDKVLFRWREDGSPYRQFSAPLYVTPGGELYFSHLFSVNVSQVEIELTIDQNNNGAVDSGEPQWNSPTLSFNQSQNRSAITINRTDFTP